MSQKQTTGVNPNMVYSVKASYYVVDIDDKGLMTEVKKENQDIQLFKLQRRNMAHSRLAMKVMMGGSDEIDLAMEYIDCCVVDEKVKEELKKDALASFEIFTSKEVSEDFRRFFEGWEFYNRLAQKPSENE